MTNSERKHREFINRWLPVRVAYMQNATDRDMLTVIQKLDDEAGRSKTVTSLQALNRRIVRFRKKYGWFMVRFPAPVITSTLGL